MINLNSFLGFLFYLIILALFLIFYTFFSHSIDQRYFINFTYLIILILLSHLIIKHRRLTDVHFYFLSLSMIYIFLVPFFVYNYNVNIFASEKFRNLLPADIIYSNIILIIGFIFYIFMSKPNYINPISLKNNYSKGIDLKIKIIALFLIFFGTLSFLRLSLSYGFDISILLGALENRSRLNFSDVYGKSYFKSLLFSFNFAFMLFLYIHRNKNINYFLTSIFLFYLLIVLTVFDGQRIQTIGFMISAIIIYRIKHISHNITQYDLGSSFTKIKHNDSALNLRIIITGFIFLIFLIVYGQYRSGNIGEYGLTISRIFEDWSQILFYVTNLFDSAITYPIVVSEINTNGQQMWNGKSILMPIINRVPTILFPDKLDYMYGAGRFSLEFLGYDQLDETTVSRSCSLFCNLYLNFGSIGVIAAPILFSLFGNYLNKKLSKNYDNYFIVILFVSMCSYLLPYAFKANIFQTISMFDVKLLIFFITVYFSSLFFTKREN